MNLVFKGHVEVGDSLLDTDLRDLTVVSLGGETVLFGTTGANGGLIAWTLDDSGGLATLIDTVYFPAALSGYAAGIVEYVDLGGEMQVIFGGVGGDSLLGYGIDAGGAFTAIVETQTLSASTTSVADLAQVDLGGSQVVYVVDQDSGALTAYSVGADGSIAELPQPPQSEAITLGGPTQVATATIGGNDFLLVSDFAIQGVSAYSVDPGDGSLALTGQSGQAEGLGIATPTAMEVVQAFGQTWVIVGAAGSSSISVFNLDPTGSLTPVDHVIDTLNTRFGRLTALSVVQDGDRVFLVAGGADDGLSLFTLLPDGRLVHLQTLVQTDGAGLDDITSLSATLVGDEIQVFVASESAPGLSQFALSLSGLGTTAQGIGAGDVTLTGTAGEDMLFGLAGAMTTFQAGAGNDIIAGGAGDSVMTGGGGADIFILQQGGYRSEIMDFQSGIDVLDLSGFLFLRSPGQLNLTLTSDGAVLTYYDESIVLHAADGGPLDLSDIFGAGFRGPDRVPLPGFVLPVAGIARIGDDGSDILNGTEGADTLSGNGGADQLFAAGGNDQLDGGSGNDTLWGGDGNDALTGGTGSDLVIGEDGNDLLDGGDDDDLVWAGTGDDTAFGSDGSDRVAGGDGSDLLNGGAGSDTLWGHSGNDTLYGSDGDDQIGAYLGDDVLSGGDGNDVLWAHDGNDTVYGGTGNDEISAGPGEDVLYGGAGNDTIWASDGNDHIDAGPGADTVTGGAGMDTILGGSGDDLLTGGGGADEFHFLPGDGADTITGFVPGADLLYIHDPAMSFADLIVVQQGADVMIGYGSDLFVLSDIDVSAIGADDFTFSA